MVRGNKDQIKINSSTQYSDHKTYKNSAMKLKRHTSTYQKPHDLKWDIDGLLNLGSLNLR